jgi:hypothetical protein
MTQRKISAKELLADIRRGMDDDALMGKYGLTQQRLQIALKKMVDAGLLRQTAIDARTTRPVRERTDAWNCPACGKPQPRKWEYDECPECGVIVAKFLKQQELKRKRAEEEEKEKERKRKGQALATYSVTYLGGHPKYPKANAGGIRFSVFQDHFEMSPTMGSRGWFSGLIIPYDKVSNVEIAQRLVSGVEFVIAPLWSLGLKQLTNIHITFEESGGLDLILRLSMFTGFGVHGQARKCREFMDLLRVHGIQKKFRWNTKIANEQTGLNADIPAQIEKLAALRDKGILTENEFETKKTELLSKL